MALTIIAVVLVIVFFPILFGFAATAAIVLFAFASFAAGIGMIAYGIYCAGKAATNPMLAKRAAIIALLADLIAMPFLIRHYGGNPTYLYAFSPIVFDYAAAMMLISRNRSFRSGKAKLGMLFLVLGAILDVMTQFMFMAYMPVAAPITGVLADVLMLTAVVLLLTQPPHPDVAGQENTGTMLVSGALALGSVFGILTAFQRFAIMRSPEYDGMMAPAVGIPYSGLILKALKIVGLVLFVLPILQGLQSKPAKK